MGLLFLALFLVIPAAFADEALEFRHCIISTVKKIFIVYERILSPWIGQSNATAANWVSRNILSHVPATNITSIAVGSEVLSTLSNAAPILVSAMKYIHSALVASNLDSQIKVSTPHSSSIILDSFPPSQAFFNRTWDPVMVPLLKFLQSTGSFLMLNAYPYYDYMQSNGVIPLDYALFRPLPPNKEAVDPNTLLHYTNVFDAVVDAAYFAMSYLNFTNIPITVTESGWPSKGDSSEPDATPENANTYNSNLIRHVLNNTGLQSILGLRTYIYELYNEDLRSGPVSEKNWGLFDANGVPVYILHLTGSGTVLANDTTNQTYCVAREGADHKMLQAALDWACGPGKVDCSPLLQGQPCYDPDTVVAHASYAFDAYYYRMAMADGTCNFNGVATITTTDPSGTKRHVKSTVLELTVLLAQGAVLAAEMDKTIGARVLRKHVLTSHPRPVEARVRQLAAAGRSLRRWLAVAWWRCLVVGWWRCGCWRFVDRNHD
ncbi:LOW QUALITY PROTEIN: hypothetical protein DH2020_046278 [Rehmannia glutinosa]|uniref:X8 domain-containing protein n=1 Tax=Rehmannia glutinosa TaxID=99300 RepID=A0ABR0UBT4_REHGL